jgi:hypothetical protein
MGRNSSNRSWLIRGYRGLEKVFERKLPLGFLSETEMIQLLQRLYCKHLDIDEIINASLRKNAKDYASFLEHDKEAKADRFSISVGHNPWYIASVTRD